MAITPGFTKNRKAPQRINGKYYKYTMYRKDFIMRMIEMIGELVAGILGYIKKGEFSKASESIENAYTDTLNEDAAFFTKIPLEDLADVLIEKHNYSNGHLEILSELFYAQAELSYAQNKKAESKVFYQKSLKLLSYVLEENKVFSFEKQARMQYLKGRIDTL